MTVLDRVRAWILTYPQIGRVLGMRVDYYETEPDNSSIAPSGLVENSRKEDILGNITVENQYNFELEFVFAKPLEDDEAVKANADWLMDFQNWVQEQSLLRRAPTFGDEPRKETIKAQNGSNTYASADGAGIYTVQLSVIFIKKYEVN